MIPACAVLLGLLGPQALPPKPASGHSGAEVAVEGHPILLPELPESCAQAKAGYRLMKPLFQAHREDLRALRRALEQTSARHPPLPETLVIAPEQVSEARFLSSLVEDRRFSILEASVMDQWLAWQNDLLGRGLAHPGQASEVTSRLRLLTASSLGLPRGRERSRQVRIQTSLGVPVQTLTLDQAGWVELVVVDGFAYGRRNGLGQEAAVLANRMAPELARAWTSLAAYLNAPFTRLLGTSSWNEAPKSDFEELALHAKVHLVARFQAEMWFCEAVWAHLASEPLPPLPAQD